MAGSLNVKKISKSQKLFRFTLVLFGIVALLFVGIEILILVKDIELKRINAEVSKKQEQVENDESSQGYKKFLAVKALEDKNSGMYWIDRIEKISEILDDLKNINDGDTESTLELYDFYVSLEEISLRGIVSSLKELYYTSSSGKMKAVLDKFESLDFIDKMVIKNYTNVGDGFEFTLFANVIDNDRQ